MNDKRKVEKMRPIVRELFDSVQLDYDRVIQEDDQLLLPMYAKIELLEALITSDTVPAGAS